MPETRNIVFLGISFAGLGASHYFLKHIYPHLPIGPEITYKAILVDPSLKWYARPMAPRVAASPDLIPIDEALFDTQSGFEQYGDKVAFVQGKAIYWDEKERVVTVEKAAGAAEKLSYWALILGTGSRADSPLFSLQGAQHTDVEAAHRSLHHQLSIAKEIIIVGGGAAGVETAGEFGDALNGAAGWFSSRPSSRKAKITLITSSSRLLHQVRESISAQAEVFLNRVGVDIRYNSKVSSTEVLANGRTAVNLQNGERLEADIYIPATGVHPMTEYVPPHLRDSKGNISTNESTLRVDAAGPRVYAVGDVASYSRDNILDTIESLPVLASNLKRDLLAAHSNPHGSPEGSDRVYVRNDKETLIVAVGRSKGVGVVYGWRIPSFLVWLFKGRNMILGSAVSRIDGSAWSKDVVSKW